MPLSALILLGLFGLYLFVRGTRRTRVPADPDAETIDELIGAGSDLAEPHEIEFFLYFETREGAERIAAQVRAEGFAAEVRPTEAEGSWLCLATRLMRPELAGLRRLRDHFTVLAEGSGGAYDGWGTTVVEKEARS